MNHYAQINAQNVCVGLLETPGTIDAPHMIAIDPGAVQLGQRWTGTDWETVAPTGAELAALELAQIDAQTGMSRTMRETFIALADKVGADASYLKAQEVKAAAARAKLKP